MRQETDKTERRNRSTMIAEDFNTCLSVIDSLGGQKISKEIDDLSSNRTDLIDNYIILHLTTAEFRFFQSTGGPFTSRLHMSHETHSNKFKGIEIMQSVFSDYCNPSY